MALKFIALLPLLLKSVEAAVPLYGQCGGSGYTGETTCVSGAVCVFQNEWYSQCLAGSATTTVATTTTTRSSSTTTRSSTTTTRSSTTTTSRSSTTTTRASSTSTTRTSSGSTTPTGIPSGAITINKNGGARYTSINAALADTSSNIYYIYAGNYTEAVVVSRPNVKIYGQTTDRSTYTGNTVTISRNMPASQAGNNDLSGALRITTAATGVSLYNINVENTYGKGSQAIALSVQAGTFAAYGCQLSGYQDTLLANEGTQFYSKTLIKGATDFIFGQRASIWITKSTIQTVGDGYITASGRSTADSNYYVIDHSTITGSGKTYLGRPWRNYARVIFQYNSLGSNVRPEGWVQWNTDDPRLDNILFGEYQNTGAGAWSSSRPSFATLLSSPVSISTVLGSTSWIDSAYL